MNSLKPIADQLRMPRVKSFKGFPITAFQLICGPAGSFCTSWSTGENVHRSFDDRADRP